MSRIKAVFVSLYHCSLVVLNIYLLDFIFSSSEGSFLAIAPAVALGIAKMGASAIQMIQQNAAQKAATIEAAKVGKSIADRKFINKFAALQAPTTGSELKMEDIQRREKAILEAAKETGARGVIGTVPRITQETQNQQAQVAARLDDLQLRLDNKFLTEEQRIGLMNERKDLQLDYQRLAGAQGAATAAGTASNQALAGLIGGAGETIAGGIAASDLYRGNQEIDVSDTTIDTTIDNTNLTANANQAATQAGIDQIKGMQLEPEIDPGTLQPEINLNPMQVNAPGLTMDPAVITQKMKAQGRSDAQINYLLEDPSSFEEYLKTL